MGQQTVASVAQNRLPYGSVRAYPRHRLPAAPGRRRTTCAAAFCKLHVCTSRSLLWPAGPSWLLPRSQVPSAVTQLLLENASLIIFSTYSPPQAAPGCQILFTRGRAKKKVVGESQKCEKLRPAAPAPESSAPPRSSHVTASCGFTECLQAIDRHATAKQGIRD